MLCSASLFLNIAENDGSADVCRQLAPALSILIHYYAAEQVS